MRTAVSRDSCIAGEEAQQLGDPRQHVFQTGRHQAIRHPRKRHASGGTAADLLQDQREP